jgi:hypothetical protein
VRLLIAVAEAAVYYSFAVVDGLEIGDVDYRELSTVPDIKI